MRRKLINTIISVATALALSACSQQLLNTSSTTAEADERQETTARTPAMTETSGEDATPKAQEKAIEYDGISFTAFDLDGNQVSAEDIFGSNELTMVNVWATFCGPCIGEMPELEVLSGRLKDKGCAIIGVVCDIYGTEDTSHISDAKSIISDTGVTYLNLMPWETFDDIFPAMYVPTTYFVDRTGHIVGEEAVGARGADDYEALVDSLLKQ